MHRDFGDTGLVRVTAAIDLWKALFAVAVPDAITSTAAL